MSITCTICWLRNAKFNYWFSVTMDFNVWLKDLSIWWCVYVVDVWWHCGCLCHGLSIPLNHSFEFNLLFCTGAMFLIYCETTQRTDTKNYILQTLLAKYRFEFYIIAAFRWYDDQYRVYTFVFNMLSEQHLHQPSLLLSCGQFWSMRTMMTCWVNYLIELWDNDAAKPYCWLMMILLVF